MVGSGSRGWIRGIGQVDECRLEDKLLYEIDFERFIEYNLGIRELIVSQMLVSGYTIVEIAKHQGVSRRFITRVVKELRNKFRGFLEEIRVKI